MSLSKRHLGRHTSPVDFDVDALADFLRKSCPEVLFAFLLGSSQNGRVDVEGDIDLALFVDGDATLQLHATVSDLISRVAPGVHADVGFLNAADPVYRFEALKGHLLFSRDQQAYARFFSLSCREYESKLFDYERQYCYRTGAA